ncbi:C6 finger domain transcription factor nosA [Hypsizygus marmoreus]|uniref:C6 finger domain transcription factor nosA n=1 Tax=Hypsizygus marmoreus TaxID=39966 RepID=A0A369K0T4_HYPMA|nr:C6 finger domain transcription factor nosA [Hypsizygus marmoreus]
MPAVPKSSSSTKRGAPKAKGAVRAKSGCYTCRIRRKKCDEEHDQLGRCQTCVRLRLECLGFGAKRPEWLRETRNVIELREKIKAFLAAQGMIKGHSGSGPRGSEHEQPTLRLTDEYSSSSESPPTPTLSLASDSTHRHHNVSSVREDTRWASAHHMDSPGYQSSNLYPMRSDSPYSSSQGSVHDTYPVDSSNSLSLSSASPALFSGFSPLYNFVLPLEDMQFFEQTEPLPRNPAPYMTTAFIDEHLKHYMKNVVGIQYLLADESVRSVIFDAVTSQSRPREAASLLASVHWQRHQNPRQLAFQNPETRQRLASLISLLGGQSPTAGDAMAALHVVSSILFDGGKGAWEEWLLPVYLHVDKLFHLYGGPSNALSNCQPNEAFIIKTAIWFDVLASVTTGKEPYFHTAIRVMFHPGTSRVYEVASASQYSMMSPMGCQNVVVWALAETSSLAYWKRSQLEKGALSMPLLVRRGEEIDEYLAPPLQQDVVTGDLDGCRLLASEIFRASTRLYLRSVMSGDYPHVPEIQESVRDTVRCIQRINEAPPSAMVNGQRFSRSVVRNTVFGFFVCGAFAETNEHRSAILEILTQEEEDGVGNCSTIRDVLQQIWSTRGNNYPNPVAVEWRSMLDSFKILLV